MVLRRWANVLAILFCGAGLAAQAQDRIVGRIDPSHTVVLNGSRHPSARPEFDQGPVDPATSMSVTVLLKPSAAQQNALQQLLADQQDPSSPNYHQWLTPEQYADRFGASPADVAQIAAWLKSEGFQVGYVARGRGWIVFNGTAAQVGKTLHTEIHRYLVQGVMHYANATESSVPAAIAPLVGGLQGLDDFRMKPQGRGTKLSAAADSLSPQASFGSTHYLAPDDFATIYDVSPLYSKGINGTGQKIVVPGETDISLEDIQTFRSMFDLPAATPQMVLVPCSYYSLSSSCTSDPGTNSDVLFESDLDLEWSGAVARNATQIYVNSVDVLISVEYAIDQDLAPVISFSYGFCELEASTFDATAYEGIAQQANAEGITWVASSGDAGAAGCDPQGEPGVTVAVGGLAVDLPASVPEITAVGGTEFNEGNGAYWTATNSVSGASAVSYIPEVAWNETSLSLGLAASGGGLSILYAKPSWQLGLTALSAVGRGVPDVSLSSAFHDGYLVISGGEEYVVFGTSASAQAFAGLVVLVDQSASPSGLGNINPTLYRRAQTPGVFHDITSGSNIVSCVSGSPNCSNGLLGYNAAPGYDLVTGLGSVDAGNLVTEWNAGVAGSTATTTTVSASPSSISAGGSAVLTATVTANSKTTPSGTVTFYVTGGITIGTATLSGSGNSSSASLTVNSDLLGLGIDTISVSYSGSASLSASSGSVAIDITAGPAAMIAVGISPTPVYEADSEWLFSITLTETAGVSATLTGFSIGGTDESSNIVPFFGSATIPALRTLSTLLFTTDLAVPANTTFLFSGVDANGKSWSQAVTVPFLGSQGAAVSYYFAHLTADSIWRTTFTYVNASTRAVSCTTSFFSNSGAPLALPFNGQSVTSTTDSIAAGGIARRQTDAQPGLLELDGWARADCTGPVKASALFRSYNGATPTGEASVLATTAPATTFVSYADALTGVAWANPSPNTALLDLEAVDESGNVIASNQVALPSGYHGDAILGSLLNLPSGMGGSVVILATQPIILLTLNFDASPVFSSLPPAQLDSSTPTGAANYYFAHLATAANWRTTFTYVNLSLQSVTCQTSFFSNTGGALSLPFNGTSVVTTTDVIAAGGTAFRQTDAQPNVPEVDGWAMAHCTGPVKASALFRAYNGTVATGEASVIATTAPATTFVTYADQTTGLAWANPSSSSATLTLTAKDATGAVLGTATVTLSAGAHGSANVGPLLKVSSFTGSLKITSTQPITSLALNFEAYPSFSSLPPGN